MYIQKSLLGQNQFWRYVFVIIAVFGAQLLGIYPAFFLDQYSDSNSLDLLANIFPFICGLVVFLFIFSKLHDRPVLSVLTSRESLDWSRIAFACFLSFGLFVGVEFFFYNLDPTNYNFTLKMPAFLYMVVISVLFIPLQSSLEEVIFRGYLFQGLSQAGGRAIVGLILSSLLFASMHSWNPEIERYGFEMMFTYYTLTGVFLTLLTYMDKGMELALGFHALNNIFGVCLLNYPSSALKTDSMFQLVEMEIITVTLGALIVYIVFIVICSIKYKWTDWAGLFRPISRRVLSPEFHHEVIDNEDVV